MRIIAGKWRRRRVVVTSHRALRPSGDRVRETLFNWLNPFLPGARCLDLFAGSGVLSFEALSRGAAEVTMVEKDTEIVGQLTQSADQFDATGMSIIHRDALVWLAETHPRAFDIIFLDPPFHDRILRDTLGRLVDGWLSPRGLIYVESGEKLADEILPEQLEWTKHAQLGNVSIGLARMRDLP